MLPKIQNQIIQFVIIKVRGFLMENSYHCITADEHANREVLFECLRFLQVIITEIVQEKMFFRFSLDISRQNN